MLDTLKAGRRAYLNFTDLERKLRVMKTVNIGGKIETGAIALGCMRINTMSVSAIQDLINTALDGGIDFFDHADIYGGGDSESLFSQAVEKSAIPRDKLLIQTKCGIRNGMFDFSKEHIVTSLENSLKRLDMDYVDIFLLHRPDTLMEPEEVAEAFAKLHKAGKARAFGVSNHNSGQIRLLSKYLNGDLAIVVNQLQFSPTNTGMIDSGLNVNMENPPSVDHDGSILEFCRYEDITIQAWSPFQYGFFEGVFLGSEKYPKLNDVINDLAKQKGNSDVFG
jgi:predicted oxidoreductase